MSYVTNDKLDKTIKQNEEIINLLKVQIMLACDDTPISKLISRMKIMESNAQREELHKKEESSRRHELEKQARDEEKNREKIQRELEKRKRNLEDKDKEITTIISASTNSPEYSDSFL